MGKTEAGVSVPVKESIDLRGGVRVDSRRAAASSAPSVGIDVRL